MSTPSPSARPALLFDLDGTLVDGSEELETAGAYRVYDGPGHLLVHLDELGDTGRGLGRPLIRMPPLH